MTERPPGFVVGGEPCGSVLPPGWNVTALADVPAEPFDLTSCRLAVVHPVRDASDARAVLLAAARGVAVVTSIGLEPSEADDFLDDLSRLTEMHTCDRTVPLLRDHVELLRALAAGATLTAAAAQLGLSRRTAVRRLGEARDRLGVSTTAEALARYPLSSALSP